jgi:hypothetical protein
MCPRLPVAAGVALGLHLFVASPFCLAAPARIRLSRPANGNALVRELTARAAGEAVAAGFSVDLEEQSTSTATNFPQAEPPPGDTPPVATIVIGAGADDPQDGRIEVTVHQQVIYRATVRHEEVTPAAGGRILAAAAVRAVAALQTAILDQRSPKPIEPVLPAAAPPLRAEVSGLPRAARRIAVGVAASLLQSLQGIPPAFVPTAQFSYYATHHLAAGLRLMGLGTSAATKAPAGSARVRQTLAMADLSIRFRPGNRIHPVLMGGAGAYVMSVEGTGTSPYLGRTDRAWYLATDAGVGVIVDVTARVSVALESHTLWVWPQPMVQIESVDAGRAGRPSLTHSLGLMVWL